MVERHAEAGAVAGPGPETGLGVFLRFREGDLSGAGERAPVAPPQGLEGLGRAVPDLLRRVRLDPAREGRVRPGGAGGGRTPRGFPDPRPGLAERPQAPRGDAAAGG